jgi:hypothetical protein
MNYPILQDLKLPNQAVLDAFPQSSFANISFPEGIAVQDSKVDQYLLLIVVRTLSEAPE